MLCLAQGHQKGARNATAPSFSKCKSASGKTCPTGLTGSCVLKHTVLCLQKEKQASLHSRCHCAVLQPTNKTINLARWFESRTSVRACSVIIKNERSNSHSAILTFREENRKREELWSISGGQSGQSTR